MKTVLSFILVLFFSLQGFSQNLSFTKINGDKLNPGSYKTGKVIHYPPEFNYDGTFVYSTDKGKTLKEKEIPDIIDEAKNEYIHKSKEDVKYLEDFSTYLCDGIYNNKFILFFRNIGYDNEDERVEGYEAAYSEDGLRYKYVFPFIAKGFYTFELIDDNHFIADDLSGNVLLCTIIKKGADIKIETTPVDLPVKKNYFCLYTAGKIIYAAQNKLYISHDLGKSFNEIYSNNDEMILQKVSSNDKYIMIQTNGVILISNDKGKTFLSIDIYSIHGLPVYYKNKYYYIKQSEGIWEIIVNKTSIEEKAVNIKNTPPLSYMCTELKEIDGKIILIDGTLDGYSGECYDLSYYQLK